MNKTRLIVLISSIIAVFGLIAGGLWYFYRPQAASTCAAVMVFKGEHYSGTSACFNPGDYKKADLVAKGISNDSISSVKVPSGMNVNLYENDNFGGHILILSEDVSSLDARGLYGEDHRRPSWDNEASSLKVIYAICPAPTIETRTQSCAAGQTGSITQTRTRGATPTCTWGDWKQTNNTCATPTKPTPSVNLKANGSNGPITVDYDSRVKLSWTSSDTDKCTASGAWSDSKGTSGSEDSKNLTSNTIFVLTCNGNGNAVDSVTINVNAKTQDTDTTTTGTTTTGTTTTDTTTAGTTTDDAANTAAATEPIAVGMPDKTAIVENTTKPAATDTNSPTGTTDTANNSATTSVITDNTTDITDQSAGDSTSSGGTNWLIIITIGAVVIAGGIYAYVRFKGSQLTGEDLLARPDQSEGEIVLDHGGKPAPAATPPNLQPTEESPSLNEVLPKNVADTTGQEKNVDDMSID